MFLVYGRRINACALYLYMCSFISFSTSTEAFFDRFLKSCNFLAPLKQTHASLLTSGLLSESIHLGARIILKYAQLGEPRIARSVFDIIRRDRPFSFLWNTMIRAYANGGSCIETLELYSLMRRSGISSNNYTYPFVFRACALKCRILEGVVVHGDVIKTGFELDLYVQAALADMYAKCGWTDDGRKVFDEMPERDIVCWTTIITAYEQAGQPKKALDLFKKMQKKGILADEVSVISVASAVGQLGDAVGAQLVHAFVISNGFLDDVCVGNAVVAMHSRCGYVDKARLVFDSMSERDDISWNSMLAGYTQNGRASEALLLFNEMMESSCTPNPVTMLIMVSVCADLGSKQVGKKIHDVIRHRNTEVNGSLRNALMDMYAKCGDLETALRMFNDIHPNERDVKSWNVLISGYGMHGYGKEALSLFSQMQQEDVEPDHITFVSLLSACSHAGLIAEGKKCFADMKKHSLTPQERHYACMVDMLGRAGLLYEAFDMIKQMPIQATDEVWGALLLACRIHGNPVLGETVTKNLLQIEPEHAGYYALMSNVYAASNKWQEVGNLRLDLRNRGLKKPSAYSMIEFGNGVHGFHRADQVNLHKVGRR